MGLYGNLTFNITFLLCRRARNNPVIKNFIKWLLPPFLSPPLCLHLALHSNTHFTCIAILITLHLVKLPELILTCLFNMLVDLILKERMRFTNFLENHHVLLLGNHNDHLIIPHIYHLFISFDTDKENSINNHSFLGVPSFHLFSCW